MKGCEMPSLKPCPFCGNKEIQYEMPIPHHPSGYVEHNQNPVGWITGLSCLECGCEMKANAWDEISIVDRWNNRAKINEEKLKFTDRKPDQEYHRRNLLHAKSVGVYSGIKSVIDRLEGLQRKPKWLLEILHRELIKAESVEKEMAAHREERN